MKISYNWLRNYLPLDLPPGELADILTNIGLEVEGVETYQSVKGGLEGVVVGEVLSCGKHPNADRLSVTSVDIGAADPLPIVCGAPNVREGQKVLVATVGTTLYPGGEPLEIRRSRIRGETSEGMICAEDELGLGSSHDGILVLGGDAEKGRPATDYFPVETDTVFEIGLTPNRIDAASHLGVARDLAAYFSLEEPTGVQRPSLEGFSIDHLELPIPVEIEEKAGCRRYSGITLSGIRVAESPGWLKRRLESIGLSPINNVVDITNFVLHETGQPLHAFDADRIAGNRVIVRTLPGGTKFTTLDEVERTLQGEDLMICNEEEGMCIAGVFGGIGSGVTNATRRIFLESACFDPVYIRKTARHHGLSTDASFRFERGSDPNLTPWALKRAALMIREIAGGEISSELVDVYPDPVPDREVEILFSNVDRLIGNHIDPKTIQQIVESLEMKVEVVNETGMLLRVPPYRVDVTREADVIEEILRIYGFNRVQTGEGMRSNLVRSGPDREKLINRVSDMLTGNGFFEMKSNSLTRAAYHDRGGTEDPEAVRIYNPLSQDLAHMRKVLLNGGLEAVSYNINRQHSDLKLYEFGYTYRIDPSAGKEPLLDRYTEELRLGLFLTGNTTPGNWAQKAQPAGFAELKRYVESCLRITGIDPAGLETTAGEEEAYGECMEYRLGDGLLVRFGKVKGDFCAEFDIKQQVFAAEFIWERVMRVADRERILFRPLPRFPSVTRDFSLLLDRSVRYRDLERLAFQTEKKLLKRVDLFDVYEGDKIEEGKKSYALTFTLLDENKTLTDKVIDKTMMRLARAFEKELGARVRGLES